MGKIRKHFFCLFANCLVCIASLFLSVGCSTDLYDYDELNDRMEIFDKRLAALEEWCKETNTNINSLKVLVESLLENDMVKSVTPVLNGNEVIGYTVTFLKADPITIYHGEKGADGEDGKDGEDGYTPVIGVKQDTDGIYYWMLNGEWLKDAEGHQVKAQGEDGADGQNGKDGVVPQLKIENKYWHISYDGGQTWTQLEKAIGEDGQDGEDGKDGLDGKDGQDGASFFQSVDYTTSSEYVEFTFSDGTKLKIPTWSAFETYRNQVNTTVSSLQTLVTALQQHDYITGYEPYLENGKEVGYAIKFAKANPIVIYHGQDGKDGIDGDKGEDGEDAVSPMVGVKKDTDDIYYWTLNGEWLKDNQGNKVKAQGVDGTPGENGVSPQVKIGDDGYWYVSYDGTNWTKLGDKPASAGNDVFKEIKIEPGKVIFVLKDGTELTVPTYQKVEIAFTMDYEKSGIAANEVIYVPYTLTHATANTLVTASSDGNYVVVVEPKDQNSGQIIITAPNEYVDGFVNVHIDNGNGFSSVHVINFYHQQMHFSNGQEYVVAAEGQTLTVPVSMNFNYTVDIPSSVKSWVSLADSRAIEFRDETLTFTFPANPNKSSRSASVGIIPNNAKEPLYYITFNQASAYFSIDMTRLVVDGKGETMTVNIKSSLGLKVVENADWIAPTVTNNGTQYTLQLVVDPNDTGTYRKQNIQLYEDEAYGTTLLGEINVFQLSQTSDDQKNMVIEVSANPANSYKVTLPLYKGVDCVVDWGDGIVESVTGMHPSHTYTGLVGATHYDVKIMGTVQSLTTLGMDDIKRNGIFAVKQWGQTGLTDMTGAFQDCVNLKSVPADNTGAFAQVKNFSGCFSGCAGLTSISEKLFTHAIEATSFTGVFNGCTGITEIPAKLFENCVKVTSFNQVFSGTSITTVSEDIFKNCPEVTDFSSAFEYCYSFTTVSEKLFVNNENVKDFSRLFRHTAIVTVPDKLFDTCTKVTTFHKLFNDCNNLKQVGLLFKNCSQVTDFSELFHSCGSIEEIPADLFKGCPNVTNFSYAFSKCINLKNVPVSIFDNNRKVTDFDEVFYRCENWEGESPYTMIGGVKVHLYERHLYGEEFIKPTKHYQTFEFCKKLTDSVNIPTDWK